MGTLTIEPLTSAAFAPFGQVIETSGAQHYPINNGMTERYHDLARVELGHAGIYGIVMRASRFDDLTEGREGCGGEGFDARRAHGQRPSFMWRLTSL